MLLHLRQLKLLSVVHTIDHHLFNLFILEVNWNRIPSEVLKESCAL